MATTTLTFIALRTVKYNDRNSILSGYSREEGPVSLLVPAGTGREAVRVRALTTPLSVVECEATRRPGRDLYRLSSPRACLVTPNLLTDPARCMTAQFLAEVLSVVLREGQAEERLFDFLTDSITVLDTAPHPANFHLAFLVGLAAIIGIAPDVTGYRPGSVFDMKEGVFRLTHPLHRHFLSGEDSEAMFKISRISYSNMEHFRLTRDERNRALDTILDYYTMHYAPLGNLQSLSILRSLF